MLDQAVVSCGNFLLTLLLARWMSARDYGAFVLLFGALQVTNVVHQSLISYPISVLGAQKERAELAKFAANSVLLTSTVDCVLAIALGAIAWFVIGPTLSFACGLAVLASHVQETYRRVLMSHLRHKAAIAGDAAMFLGQVVGVYFVQRFFILNLEGVFVCIGVFASLGAIVQIIQVGCAPINAENWRRSFSAFWALGRWPLLANTGYSLTMQAFPWLLARQGFAMAAAFQAVLNVVAFTNPLAFSIGNLLVPAIAHELVSDKGVSSAIRLTRNYAMLGAALLSPFLLTPIFLPSEALVLFYGASSPYLAYGQSLQMIAVGFGLACLAHIAGSYFLGSKRPQVVLWTQLAGCCVAFAIAPLAMKFHGVRGAALAFLAMSVVRFSLLMVEIYRDAVLRSATDAELAHSRIPMEQRN